MKKLAAVSAAALIALSVAACGETRGERALTGGAIGAGAGALGGAALGFDPLTGAVIGGAAGAVAGAASGERDRRDRRASRDSDGDGIPNYDDRYPRNPYRN